MADASHYFCKSCLDLGHCIYLAIEDNGSGGRSVLEDGKDLVKNLFLRSLILSEWNTKSLNFADLLGKISKKKLVSPLNNVMGIVYLI